MAPKKQSKGALTGARRKALPKKSFVFPGKAPASGSYPIHNLSHARNALARSSGKPEAASVRRKVYAKYPQLRKNSK